MASAPPLYDSVYPKTESTSNVSQPALSQFPPGSTQSQPYYPSLQSQQPPVYVAPPTFVPAQNTNTIYVIDGRTRYPQPVQQGKKMTTIRICCL